VVEFCHGFLVGGGPLLPQPVLAGRYQRGHGARCGRLHRPLSGLPGVARADDRGHNGARNAERADPARDPGGGDGWVHAGHASAYQGKEPCDGRSPGFCRLTNDRLPPTVVAQQPVKPAPPFNYGPVWVGLLLAAALGALVLAARKLKLTRR
jgi:hypothetical protein